MIAALAPAYERATKMALQDPEKWNAWTRRNREQMDGTLRAIPGLGHLMGGYEWLFEKVHGRPPPTAADPHHHKAPDLAGLSARQKSLQGEIDRLETRIARIKDGPTGDAARRPLQDQLDILNMQMNQLVGDMAAAGSGPITRAIRDGKARAQAPDTSPHPPGMTPPRPAPYIATQPNVSVQSTFESHPAINVSVTTPIRIERAQRHDNRAIAAQAGREARDVLGAATERAVRRSLDDAANME